MLNSPQATEGKFSSSSDTQRMLQSALAPIQQELVAVDGRLHEGLTDPLAQRVAYLVAAGGKRLRPAMVLLTGKSGPSPRLAALIDAACAVELIHTATLIHDDIIDVAALRRQQPAFHERWGTERALLTGDYLYATAFALLSRLDDAFILRVMADVCQELSRGELNEVEARHRLDLSESEYFCIIRDKTASLTSGCCRIGARLGGFGEDAVKRWDAFGLNFGLAFQIVDDCLDLTGDPRELGKFTLADLDKGVLSLPMIYLAQALDAHERERVFAPVVAQAKNGARPVPPEAVAQIARLAAERGMIDRAMAQAMRLIGEACESVRGLSDGAIDCACQSLAEYAVSRRT